MALRKASAYSKKRVNPYTRKSRAKKRAYIKTVPQNKIVKFIMGNQRAYNDGRHLFVVRLISEERVLVRDNALESGRMLINKKMDSEVPGMYYFIVKVYPHHILRENKTAAGAGADRMSTGMTHSFGVTIGRAAIVNVGQDIFYISCGNEKAVRVAREALKAAKAKVPCRCRIVLENLSEKKKVESNEIEISS